MKKIQTKADATSLSVLFHRNNCLDDLTALIALTALELTALTALTELTELTELN